MTRRIPILEQCAQCGQRVVPGRGFCKRHLRERTLAEDLARPFPTLPMTRVEHRQAEEAREFGSSVLVPILDKTCSHRGDGDWCVWCEGAADFDDGGTPWD